jgi:hypothetical protein
LSLYCVDFNSTTRSQKIEILDVSGRVLDTRSLSSFWQGVYLSWNVSGAVKIRVTRTGAYNGLVSALFLD